MAMLLRSSDAKSVKVKMIPRDGNTAEDWGTKAKHWGIKSKDWGTKWQSGTRIVLYARLCPEKNS